jgi:redox-sensitive bicupin YhaK (pirin superfamily)
MAQRMSAGSGILHSEKNDSSTQSVHFVQMWVTPDETDIDPGYQQQEIADRLYSGGLVTIASGIAGHDAAISLHNRSAALHCARLDTGGTVNLPTAPYLHVFVARGALTLECDGKLSAGDAVRLTSAEGPRLSADEAAEVLIWEMHAGLGS